jgi:lysophospholipid acyltransferase (LPLAT)-like uncharacterized protein
LRNPQLRCAVCWAIHCYIRLVYRTNRWTVVNGEWPRQLLTAGRPFIGAFWHGRMMMIPLGWGRMASMHMLISAHRDGRIIADAVAYFGIKTIAGSTQRGGSAALRMMLKRLTDGDCVAITPDGPRGPAMRASIGIVNVARLAQVPIVPITFATSRRRIAATWDQFYIALPFGRGIFLWGEPIEIAAELDEAGLEDARRLVEARMGEMVLEADRRMGHPLSLVPDNGEIATHGLANTAAAMSVSPSPIPNPPPQSSGPGIPRILRIKFGAGARTGEERRGRRPLL